MSVKSDVPLGARPATATTPDDGEHVNDPTSTVFKTPLCSYRTYAPGPAIDDEMRPLPPTNVSATLPGVSCLSTVPVPNPLVPMHEKPLGNV
jgi:hypothetical protein